MVLVPGWAFAHPGSEQHRAALDHQLEQQPNNQYLHIQRGISFLNDANYPLALQEFQLAETIGDPLQVAAAFGIYYYRQGDFAKSRQYFDRFLAVYPDHVNSLGYRARMLRDAGEYRAALADYQHYISLVQQPDPGLLISMANMMLQLPEYGVEPTLLMLDGYIKIHGPILQLQRFAIGVEMNRKNYAAVVARMQALPPEVKLTPDWHVEIGQAYENMGEVEQASQYYLQAQALLERRARTRAAQALAVRVAALLQNSLPTSPALTAQ